jgi:hypothetical protein
MITRDRTQSRVLDRLKRGNRMFEWRSGGEPDWTQMTNDCGDQGFVSEQGVLFGESPVKTLSSLKDLELFPNFQFSNGQVRSASVHSVEIKTKNLALLFYWNDGNLIDDDWFELIFSILGGEEYCLSLLHLAHSETKSSLCADSMAWISVPDILIEKS